MREDDEERLLTPVQLADRWGVSVRLLATWRHQRRGPAYLKIEHAVRYRLRDVEAYERSQRVA